MSTIKSQLDPFNAARGEDHLAFWGKHNEHPSKKWWNLSKPPPLGPVIEADVNTCLNVETLHLSRKPITQIGVASWTSLLAVFHPHPSEKPQYHSLSDPIVVEDKDATSTVENAHGSSRPPSPSAAEKTPIGKPWHKTLGSKPLIFHQDVACSEISRLTLISFILLSQAREIYRYDGAAGLRMGFASYNGFYQIEWPLGQRPTLKFEAHEVYQRGKDAFPICFARRPGKCNEMAVGVIDRGVDMAGKPRKVAFAGRKKAGMYVLKLLPKRFGAQRSAADLYNMLGGEAHAVDFFFREQIYVIPQLPELKRELIVPSLVEDLHSTIYVGQSEAIGIADCLDHLPWSPIAWSIHRGMKDILVAYAKPYMVAYRERLAEQLSAAVKTHTYALRHRGWEPEFVRDHMAEQAASAILGDDRCSGDVCRIVAAITELLCDKGQINLDHTKFWVQHLNLPNVNHADDQVSLPNEVNLPHERLSLPNGQAVSTEQVIPSNEQANPPNGQVNLPSEHVNINEQTDNLPSEQSNRANGQPNPPNEQVNPSTEQPNLPNEHANSLSRQAFPAEQSISLNWQMIPPAGHAKPPNGQAEPPNEQPHMVSGQPTLREEQGTQEPLSPDTMVALVKVFFVWWSHDFDYEVYHKLPLKIIVT